MDLNAQLQEKVFAITTLKNELRRIKGKNVVNNVVLKPNATLAPGMFKLDIEPISARLKNNRDAHEVYIEKTIEFDDTLRGFVDRARTQYPSKPLLESACMFTKHVQELDITSRLFEIMTLGVRTRSAGRPVVESRGGRTGNDQGLGANGGVEGVNGNVKGVNGGVGGAPDFSTIIAKQL
ncbi:hypothetical protein Tco_0359739 [Tanacetum coccineum]